MSPGVDIVKPIGMLLTSAPVLTASPRPYHIALDWSLPPALQSALGNVARFNIYRCGPGSGNCTPTTLLTNVPGSQFSLADADVQPGQTYCYAVTYLYDDCEGGLTESPLSNIACGQICTNGCPQPEILITGNNANSDQYGNGPIQTYDFADGSLVHSFFPDGAMDGVSGRGLAIQGDEIFYTEVPTFGAGSCSIHVCPYGIEGSGGPDDPSKTISNPDTRPNAGIQDLAFHNGELYILTGYNRDDNLSQPPEIFEIDANPNSQTYGEPIAGPFPLTGQADDGGHATNGSDGFAVLPNGGFLINEGDGSPVYDEYKIKDSNAVLIPQSQGGLRINLSAQPFGYSQGTGVAVAPDGQSLYFIANINSPPQVLIHTDLTGGLIDSKSISIKANVEDIDIMIIQ
jgi:hypothetical protein